MCTGKYGMNGDSEGLWNELANKLTALFKLKRAERKLRSVKLIESHDLKKSYAN